MTGRRGKTTGSGTVKRRQAWSLNASRCPWPDPGTALNTDVGRCCWGLVLLQGPRGGPWHSGAWGAPRRCFLSPLLCQTPEPERRRWRGPKRPVRQRGLDDVYRTFRPNAGRTFPSSARGTSAATERRPRHKAEPQRKPQRKPQRGLQRAGRARPGVWPSRNEVRETEKSQENV